MYFTTTILLIQTSCVLLCHRSCNNPCCVKLMQESLVDISRNERSMTDSVDVIGGEECGQMYMILLRLY